jgi:hypothetical protein
MYGIRPVNFGSHKLPESDFGLAVPTPVVGQRGVGEEPVNCRDSQQQVEAVVGQEDRRVPVE